jgi:SAM-dependent methyltransferase
MISQRKQQIRALADQLAPDRASWVARNGFYYEEDERFTRFLIPPGQRVLDLGCGDGRLLATLRPRYGVGVDFSERMVDEARRRHPQLEFVVGDVEDADVLSTLDGPFDYIVISDTIGSLDDVQATLASLHGLCTSDTRVVICYYNRLWAPLLRLGQWLGLQMPQREQNWLSGHGVRDILGLADFDVVRLENRQVLPRRAFGLGRPTNRYVGTLPGLRAMAIRSYAVARSRRAPIEQRPSVSIVVPCRNEAGNVASAVERTPRFCDELEFVFVEGHSTDHTYQAIEEVIRAHPEVDITLARQDGTGKGDAVRKGFALARNDLLMILDADLTTPPEDLPKFYDAIVSGKGEFVMGSRLVYPLEDDAMRTLNIAGNKLFSSLFTWILHQRITDTLCGTKVISRANYERIRAGRSYFGDFDPFGDFDLILGAAKLNLRILEVPVRYRARTYGTTQISRFRHGWLLLRMTRLAFRRLQAI